MGRTVTPEPCIVIRSSFQQPVDTCLWLTDESARFCEGTPTLRGLPLRWWQCWPHPTPRSCVHHERWYAWWCPELSLWHGQRLVNSTVPTVHGREYPVWQVINRVLGMSKFMDCTLHKTHRCVIFVNTTKCRQKDNTPGLELYLWV